MGIFLCVATIHTCIHKKCLLLQYSFSRSSWVHHGDDECPRVRQLWLVPPSHNTEPCQTVSVKGDRHILFFPILQAKKDNLDSWCT